MGILKWIGLYDAILYDTAGLERTCRSSRSNVM